MRRITDNLDAWRKGLDAPAEAQDVIMESLIEDYVKTDYGKTHLSSSHSINDFPLAGYADLKPVIEKVQGGEYQALLVEEPITWVMTRGTTGVSKVIPVTQRHMDHLINGGSRAILNHAMSHGGFEMLMGGVLNLQFPSNMKVMMSGGKEMVYGFSSGTYARLNPMMAGLSLVPRQEEIDALETGLSVEDWEKRYEFIYQRAKDENIVTVMGVAPVQTGFARYLKKRHDVYPRDIWKLKVIFSTSVAKIQTKYGSWLKRLYGEAPVVEMYTATEGAFGQQMDNLPYWMPNYDLYYYEVKTGQGLKMLHELRRGEWGSVVVSTPMFPRYMIGDLVEAMGKNYFRVFGRDKPLTVLEHRVYRLLFGWFL
ncbi:MAG: GH3 auxin-responsive promoter family protein [Candidatus Bathyarchaeota archaeon]|nr:GH3 auxin-responsive promoter family protein [Candidatus Bathyarchaeota archaeon]